MIVRREIALGFELDGYVPSLSYGLIKIADGFWTSGTTEPVSYPDGFHGHYAALEDSSYWFAHRNRCIVSVVRRFAPSGPILDIGGGNGVVSLALANAGISAIVVEPSRTGADVARARGLLVIQATFESAGFVEGSVAAAGLFDVLEHFHGEAETLFGLRRALANLGWLYLTLPAFNLLWSNEDVIAGHFRRYTIGSAGRALARAGFELAFASYMFSPLVVPLFVLRSVPSMFGRLRGMRKGGAADHTLPANVFGRFIGRLLATEALRIEAGHAVPFGSSVLVAARKR
jgi:SAM-dependent methyltransferase